MLPFVERSRRTVASSSAFRRKSIWSERLVKSIRRATRKQYHTDAGACSCACSFSRTDRTTYGTFHGDAAESSFTTDRERCDIDQRLSGMIADLIPRCLDSFVHVLTKSTTTTQGIIDG
jgi:hypothetical protein